MTPATCPVGKIPASIRPSTMEALVSIGALAAIASCAHVSSWFCFIAMPSSSSSGSEVPVTFINDSALSAARGNRVSGLAFSS